MNKIEIVKAAFDLNNPDYTSFLADDFQWTSAAGQQSIDKATWLGMGEVMRASFPDLAFQISDIKEVGDNVLVTNRSTGTFVNDLDLSALGVGVVPATGKAVEFPINTDRVFFEGDKIKEIHNESTGPDAGMAGMLKALGVQTG